VAVACGGGAGGSSSPQAKTSSQTNTGEHATTQPTANANLNLRYSFPHTGAKSNFTYGVKLGYFKQAGINLTLDDGKGSETTAQTTANGSDDFGTVDGGAWLTVASKGLPAKAVMSVYGGSPNAIIVPADSNIRNPKDP
jgi:NitT/TauT family transport system substrate-binding protein